MPRIAAWPLALSALAHGGWLAWREARAARGELVIAGEGGRASVDGRAVEDLSVRWRGPIAFVEWRDGDGRRRRHVFFPDTLPAARRRELRLAAPAPLPARRASSVAPSRLLRRRSPIFQPLPFPTGLRSPSATPRHGSIPPPP